MPKHRPWFDPHLRHHSKINQKLFRAALIVQCRSTRRCRTGTERGPNNHWLAVPTKVEIVDSRPRMRVYDPTCGSKRGLPQNSRLVLAPAGRRIDAADATTSRFPLRNVGLVRQRIREVPEAHMPLQRASPATTTSNRRKRQARESWCPGSCCGWESYRSERRAHSTSHADTPAATRRRASTDTRP